MNEAIAPGVFDLDGVLVDFESVWDATRREVVARNGGRWQAGATRAMMGMSEPAETGRVSRLVSGAGERGHTPTGNFSRPSGSRSLHQKARKSWLRQ